MRTKMRLSILFVGALLGSVYACKSEPVVTPKACSSPCCDGNPLLVNCAETPDIACSESTDPCMPLAYGCMSGEFFKMTLAAPPNCAAADGASEATTPESDATTGTFGTGDEGGSDAESEGALEAATEGGRDAMTDAALDAAEGGSDAASEGGPDAALDAAADSP